MKEHPGRKPEKAFKPLPCLAMYDGLVSPACERFYESRVLSVGIVVRSPGKRIQACAWRLYAVGVVVDFSRSLARVTTAILCETFMSCIIAPQNRQAYRNVSERTKRDLQSGFNSTMSRFGLGQWDI